MSVLATMHLTSHLFSNFHVNMPLSLVIPLVLCVCIYIYILFFSSQSLILHPYFLSFIMCAGGIPGTRLLIQVMEIHWVTVKDRNCGTQVTSDANAG